MSVRLPTLPLRRPRVFYGWYVVGALFATNFAVHATGMFSFGVFLKPISDDLEVSRGAISWALTVRLLASGVTSLLIGRLLDRHGARLLIPAAAALAGVALLTLGLVEHFWQFFLLFTVVGLSGVTAPGNLLTTVPVAKWFVQKRGRATSFASAGLGIGGTVFAPVHTLLIDSFGWRTAWVASGIMLMVIVIPITLTFVRRTPEDMGLRPDGAAPFDFPQSERGVGRSGREGADAERRAAPSPAPAYAQDEAAWAVKDALRTRTLWKMLFVYMFLAFAMGGFMVHRIPFWEDRGFDRTLIATTFALDAAVFFVAILTAGFVMERFSPRYVGALAMTGQLTGIVVSILFDTTWALWLAAFAVGAGAGTNAVVQVHIWPTYYGRAFIGSIRGIVLPTTLAGQALGAPFAGYVFDAFGAYMAAFWTSAALIVTAALLLASSAPPRRQSAGQAAARAGG